MTSEVGLSPKYPSRTVAPNFSSCWLERSNIHRSDQPDQDCHDSCRFVCCLILHQCLPWRTHPFPRRLAQEDFRIARWGLASRNRPHLSMVGHRDSAHKLPPKRRATWSLSLSHGHRPGGNSFNANSQWSFKACRTVDIAWSSAEQKSGRL
jgi:hypothetical protein